MVLTTVKDGLNTVYPWYFIINTDTLYGSNGYDVPLAWDGLEAEARRWGIVAPIIPPTVAVGAAGVLNSTYYYKVTFVLFKNGAIALESNPSDASTGVGPTLDRVELSLIPQPTDVLDANRIYIWRTSAGGTAESTFRRLAFVDVGTTTYTDNTADSALFETLKIVLDHGEAPYLIYPIQHNGRAILMGEIRHGQGSVTLAGTTAVVGTGADFKEALEGFTSAIDGETALNLIETVTNTANLVLNSAASQSAAGLDYVFYHDLRAGCRWSEVFEVEYFDPADVFRIRQEDGDLITGVFESSAFLGVAKRTHTISIHTDGSPIEGQIIPKLADRGSVSQNSIVIVENQAFMLDERGMHIFPGGFDSIPISTPIQDIILDTGRTDSINWVEQWKFHAMHDANNRSVIWFVATGTDTEPHDAFRYFYETSSWTRDTFEHAITASETGQDADGIQRMWVADETGEIWRFGEGDSDGLPEDYEDTLTVRGAATGGASGTLEDTAATFPTDTTLRGLYAWNELADHTWQTARIASSTATILTLAVNWDSVPVVGSTYVIAAIPTHHVIPLFDAGDGGAKKLITAIEITYKPQTEAFDIYLELFFDRQTTPFNDWNESRDLRTDDGYQFIQGDSRIRIRMNKSDGVVVVLLGNSVRYLKAKLSHVDAARNFQLSSLMIRPVVRLSTTSEKVTT